LKVFTESAGAAPWGAHALEVEVGEHLVALVANDTVAERLVAGQYLPEFRPARNCRSESPAVGLVDVRADRSVELHLRATCDPAGTLRASLSATGFGLPSGIYWDAAQVGTGTVERIRLRTGVETEVMLAPGDWTGQAVTLPANCKAVGPDPIAFSISDGAVTIVPVSIECAPNLGWIRVALSTNAPSAWVGLSVNGQCETVIDYLGDFCIDLKPNESVLVPLPPGSYTVQAKTGFVAIVCTVSPHDPVAVEVPMGMTTDVAFTVNCP
jgi:hypothetical protein